MYIGLPLLMGCDMPRSIKCNRRKLIKAMGFLSLLGALPAVAHKTGAQENYFAPTTPIPRDYFGMHIHRAGRTQPWYRYGDSLTTWPVAKFGSWRLWDAYVSWPHLQPERDKWDFSLLDRYVAMATLTKVNILLPLGLTPQWASARPSERSSYGLGNAAEPRLIDDWRVYVRAVAQRYKGRIRHFELWNEPNLPGFFTGGPDTMLTLARETYSILKEVDSSNLLAAPATTGDHKSLEWLDRYLSLSGGKYLDILSHHFYVAQGKPEDIPAYIKRVKAITSRYGLSNVPLWNTESGFWIENQNAANSKQGIGGGWRIVPSELAAAYVIRALILGWVCGVNRYYWYSWDHESMGLLEPSSRELKPAGRAYALAVEWMNGTKIRSCSNQLGVWTCELDTATGERAWIVWREAEELAPWAVPSKWGATRYEALDGAVNLSAPMLLLGPHPIMLR